MGPTPPGFGESHEATASTPSATSPAMRFLPVVGSRARETPTSRTTAPGATISGVMTPGLPAAEMTTSARRTWSARSRVPVWQTSTVALTSLRPSSRPMERPTVTPRPMTHTSAPASSMP